MIISGDIVTGYQEEWDWLSPEERKQFEGKEIYLKQTPPPMEDRIEQIYEMLCQLSNTPTAKWIYKESDSVYASCSYCGEEVYQSGEFKYCPYCGAKMIGEDHEK